MFGGLIVTLAMKNLLLLSFLFISLAGLSTDNQLNTETQLKIQRIELQIEQLKEEKSDLKEQIENKVSVQQQQFDDLKEDLNYHGSTIDWYLSILGVLISFFGVVIPIVGFFVGKKLFQEIENQKISSKKELKTFIEKETLAFNIFKENQQKKLNDLLNDSRKTNEQINSIKKKAEESAFSFRNSDEFQSMESETIEKNKNLGNLSNLNGLLALRNFQEVIKQGKKLLENTSSANDKYHLFFILSNAYFGIGDFTTAEKYIDKAIEIKNDDYKLWANLGLTYRKLGRYKEAISAFQKAQELNKNDANPIANEALSYFELGEFIKSLETINKALVFEPNNIDFNIIKANNLFKLNQVNEAINMLNEASEKNPADYRIYKQLSTYFYRLGLFDEAIGSLNKAIQNNPEDSELFHHLGVAYTSNNEFEKALEAFKKAATMDKSLDNLLDYAESLLFNKDYKNFKTVWEKIESFDLKSKQALLGYYYLTALSQIILNQASFEDVYNEFKIHFNTKEFSSLWNVLDTESFLSEEISRDLDTNVRIAISLLVKEVKSLLKNTDR